MKTASRNGPATEVLIKQWNGIHDLVYDLEKVKHEYDTAASFRSSPAANTAKMVIRQIDRAIEHLNGLATGQSSMFQMIVDGEKDFVESFGQPDEASTAARKKMFPRSANVRDVLVASFAEAGMDLAAELNRTAAPEKKRFWIEEDRRGDVGDPKGYPSVAAAKKAIGELTRNEGYGPSEKWKSTITPKWEAWYGGPANVFEIKSWKGTDRPK